MEPQCFGLTVTPPKLCGPPPTLRNGFIQVSGDLLPTLSPSPLPEGESLVEFTSSWVCLSVLRILRITTRWEPWWSTPVWRGTTSAERPWPSVARTRPGGRERWFAKVCYRLHLECRHVSLCKATLAQQASFSFQAPRARLLCWTAKSWPRPPKQPTRSATG